MGGLPSRDPYKTVKALPLSAAHVSHTVCLVQTRLAVDVQLITMDIQSWEHWALTAPRPPMASCTQA